MSLGNFRQRWRRVLAIAACSSTLSWAQQPPIAPVRPSAQVLVRPYLPASVPPIRLLNSTHLHDLIRAGMLYLSAQDAIVLALENNIDIEVSRYDPLLAQWQLERAQAGGLLPGVPSGASQAGSVASGQGIAGSQAAAGVVPTGGNAGTGNAGNATISQIGPVTQNLDPSIQEVSTFTHRTTPQYNVTQSITPILISDTKVYNGSYQQGFLSGGALTVSYSDHYLNENAPTDVLNPSVAPNLSISFQQSLLRGFGIAVNSRTITVAKMSLGTSDLNFRTQVTNVIAQVLSVYYALVANSEDLKAKQSALDQAQALYKNNQRQVELGAMTPLDVTTAEAQMASASMDLVDSQASFDQQELQLKNLISRTGVADPELARARVVPTDRIEIPPREEFPPVQSLIQTALANRSDLAAQKANEKAQEISALGTRNGILPNSQVFGGTSQAGLAGVPRTITLEGRRLTADPYFVGGIGTALEQVFRRDFPTERIGAFIAAQVHNRQAQADFGIDQLQLRQTQLEDQKNLNQVGVDISNSIIGLQQARIRYEAAVKSRELDQQLLDAEQKKLSLGASTPYNVIVQQRDRAAAESAVISALVSYSNARIALDQTLGTILGTYHISIANTVRGQAAGPAPVSGPQQP
ncbi:MAG TPA: TolC family protein [Bryobacteraceae bacterium]|nr:TolC family protein [Bryobacteraceae bacterium]